MHDSYSNLQGSKLTFSPPSQNCPEAYFCMFGSCVDESADAEHGYMIQPVSFPRTAPVRGRLGETAAGGGGGGAVAADCPHGCVKLTTASLFILFDCCSLYAQFTKFVKSSFC